MSWIPRAGESGSVPIERVEVETFVIPTEAPESDGTHEWTATTAVVVLVRAGGETGLGYTYGAGACAPVIRDELTPLLLGQDAMAVSAAARAMSDALRNAGQPGIGAHARSAVDVALWDLKARLLGIPLVSLLGPVRQAVAAYASGGFTSYSVPVLQDQLGEWAAQGFAGVKMKVGRDPESDAARVAAARAAIGEDTELMVDANGAYDRKQALHFARAFAEHDVTWFEEPVATQDLEGMRLLRDAGPPDMEVAGGEYLYDAVAARRMLAAGAVDVLMPDATRCGGITGFLHVAALSEAFHVPVSAHAAPALHVHLGCALHGVRHVEYFHDHARVEQLLFDGSARPEHGGLRPDPDRPGLGLDLKRADAARYAA